MAIIISCRGQTDDPRVAGEHKSFGAAQMFLEIDEFRWLERSQGPRDWRRRGSLWRGCKIHQRRPIGMSQYGRLMVALTALKAQLHLSKKDFGEGEKDSALGVTKELQP
ncbi:hypothetical protein PFLUV_G00119370 [Perca fluviatilis]|uniref:Uncharacterized protein n=1 Tax=Perca fluviatilis TaxID=8168 RepID=A0A6A5F6J0_PERFL|nr:hypothetical protein PFLUV_G00119370 [Perca fluviatilis]